MFDVHHIIADGEIAKIGEEGRDFGLLPLRMGQRNFRLVEQIARPEEHQVRLRQGDSFGHIRLHDGCGHYVFREVRRLVHIHFAARLGGTAADAERHVVFVEDVGQTFDLAGAGDGKEDTLAFPREASNLFGHGSDRAVKARCRLGLQRKVFFVVGSLDPQLLNGDGGRVLQALAPLFRREIQIFRTNQVADEAAFVGLSHFRPPGIVRDIQSAGFVENDSRARQQIVEEVLFRDNQRQAVKEERRLGIDNQPYGQAYEKMDELLYDNFAYKHSVIGSMSDLDAASVDDVKQFFKTYYAPNNAVLALVGDLDTKDTLVRVKKYFGAIARQEPPKPVDLSEPEKTAERRITLDDKLARLTRISFAYHIPETGNADARALSVLASILGGGESGRLYQKLVKEKEVVTSISCFAQGRAGPSTLSIDAMVRPGKTAEEVEGLISEEIAKVLAEPVTAKELERARVSMRRAAVSPRGSVLSIANSLADNAALYNDPNRINTEYEKRLAVTAADMQKAAKTYLRTANRAVVISKPAAPAAPAPMPKQN